NTNIKSNPRPHNTWVIRQQEQSINVKSNHSPLTGRTRRPACRTQKANTGSDRGIHPEGDRGSAPEGRRSEAMNYLEQARQRWPNRHISGAGQFAIIPLDDQTCRLFVTRAEAQQVILNPIRVMVVDLN